MNERPKQRYNKSLKNIGLILVSLGMIYMLSGGSLDIITKFNESDITGKIFYVALGALIAFNVGMIIKDWMDTRKSKVIPVVMPTGVVNTIGNNLQNEQPVNSNSQQIFENFMHFPNSLNTDGLGQDAINHLRSKIEEFNQRLDSDVTELEVQYKEMDTLRKDIHKSVGDMYEEYQKLEQQMQITQNMIKTKKVIAERVKQLREKRGVPKENLSSP